MAQSPHNPKAPLERMTQFLFSMAHVRMPQNMFENFKFPAMYVATLKVLSFFVRKLNSPVNLNPNTLGDKRDSGRKKYY